MRKKIILTITAVLVVFMVFTNLKKNPENSIPLKATFWEMQSIDTVKQSRDLANQHLTNSSYDKEIENQVKKIAETGVTHIAVSTPYDSKFLPYLKRWVDISRKYGLKIWFRGNFSGWEEWFEYKRIGQEEHKKLLKDFILDNGDLFENGDIFTSCTECENGGPGDPRNTKQVGNFRQFLIDEYQITKSAFRQVDKNVTSNYYPMNFDVASLVMDKETTKALGGVVVIDHYVSSYEKMNNDASKLAESSGGKVVIGEFGAPIPDLHGTMTDSEQAAWIENALNLVSKNANVIGVNYWTGFGGSTRLWTGNDAETPSVKILKSYFKPKSLVGIVKDQIGNPIKNAEVLSAYSKVVTDESGRFSLPYQGTTVKANVNALGYYSAGITNSATDEFLTVTLKSRNEGFAFKLQKFFYMLFK